MVMNVRLIGLGRFQLLAWSIPLFLRSSVHAMVREGLAIASQWGHGGMRGLMTLDAGLLVPLFRHCRHWVMDPRQRDTGW